MDVGHDDVGAGAGGAPGLSGDGEGALAVDEGVGCEGTAVEEPGIG